MYVSDNKMYLVMEFVSRNLKQHIEEWKERDPVENARLAQSYLYQMLLAVNFCHAHRVLHRDIKPANILIDSKGNLKLADFGLGRAFSVPMMKLTHEVVTLYYRAPEILLGAPYYSTPVDIWSIGCIFAEMVTGDPLFKADSEIDALFRIFRTLGTPTDETWPNVTSFPNYKAEWFPKWYPQQLDKFVRDLRPCGVRLLSKMLQYRPNRRISAREALMDPYFRE